MIKKQIDVYVPKNWGYVIPIGVDMKTGEIIATDIYKPQPKIVDLKDEMFVVLNNVPLGRGTLDRYSQ